MCALRCCAQYPHGFTPTSPPLQEGGKPQKGLAPGSAADHPAPPTLQSQASLTGRAIRLDEDEVMLEEEQEEETEGLSVGVASSKLLPPPVLASHQLATTMGLRTHHIQVMKASFFSGEDPPPSHQPSRGTGERPGRPKLSAFTPRSRPPLIAQSQALFKRDIFVEPTAYRSPVSSAQPTPNQSFANQSFANQSMLANQPRPAGRSALGGDDLEVSAIATTSNASFLSAVPLQPAISAQQAQASAILAKHDLHSLLPLDRHSVAFGRTHLCADAGLFLGRSFRVGWGPGWTLAHAGAEVGGVRKAASSGRQLLYGSSSFSESRRPGESLPIRVVVERVNVSHTAEEKDSAVSVCVCVCVRVCV